MKLFQVETSLTLSSLPNDWLSSISWYSSQSEAESFLKSWVRTNVPSKEESFDVIPIKDNFEMSLSDKIIFAEMREVSMPNLTPKKLVIWMGNHSVEQLGEAKLQAILDTSLIGKKNPISYIEIIK